MTEPTPVKTARDTLLLSHANPEDNEFTLWLALQLANAGYRVWCDLTKLLGGEVFWDDIEEAIKTRTAKVLYVPSCTWSRMTEIPAERWLRCKTPLPRIYAGTSSSRLSRNGLNKPFTSPS